MFPSMSSENYNDTTMCQYFNSMNCMIVLNKIDILFQQIEVTSLIQDVVAILSYDCFLHHKAGLKWASVL